MRGEKRLDSNKYLVPNLFGAEDGECYLCSVMGNTARHEIFNASNREKSKRLGLWVPLCPPCHERVHANARLRTKLKQEGQKRYQEVYGDDFLNVFGRNYLE